MLLVLALSAAMAPAAWANHSGDVDCSDFAFQEDAQAHFLAHGGPAMDPDRLDADGNGVACEDRPRRGASTTTTSPNRATTTTSTTTTIVVVDETNLLPPTTTTVRPSTTTTTVRQQQQKPARATPARRIALTG